MAHRFTGTAENRLDEKHRVPVPPAFRRVLHAHDPHRDEGTQPRVHVLYGDPREPWLTCLSMKAIDEIGDLLDDMDQSHPDLPALEAYYFTHAEQLTLDGSGRIVLGDKLRARTGIPERGAAAFAGARSSFRIHSPEAPATAVDPLAARLETMSSDQTMRSLLPSRRAPAVE